MRHVTKDKGKDRVTGKDVTCLKSHRWYLSNWYNSNPKQLLAEKKDMNDRFPDFEMRKIGNELAWIGTVKPKVHNTKAYKIAIIYPKDYPNHPLVTFVIQPNIKGSMHRNPDGSLDLMYPEGFTCSEKMTAVQTVVMTVQWLYCWEYHAEHCPNGINCTKIPCPYWPGI